MSLRTGPRQLETLTSAFGFGTGAEGPLKNIRISFPPDFVIFVTLVAGIADGVHSCTADGNKNEDVTGA